jgi:hypothetical protein
VVLLSAFVACGGKSESEDDGSASGASDNGGGSGTGGGTTGGGTSGGTGNGGSSGTGGSNDACSLPPAGPGPCEAAIRRYSYHPETGLCLPFVYGGCDGNGNNFVSAEDCYGTCDRQGEMNPTMCGNSTECTLIPTTCCGGCDEPTVMNVVSIRSDQVGTVEMAMGCQVVDCPPCDPPLPNPWLFSTCSRGRCIAVDARETEITECTQASDCVLRAGLGCCEACSVSPGTIVSVNASVDLEPWLCGSTPDGCDACAPAMNNFDPSCDAMRCGVQAVSPPVD